MSSNPSPNNDRTPFARLLGSADEGYFKFESALNLIAALVILAVMFIGVFQVVGRRLYLPVPGYVDIIEFMMTVFAFISIAYTQRLGGHVRMEIILKRFRGRALWIVECLGTLTIIVIVAILAWYGYGHFLRAWSIGDSTMDIEIPLWPSKLLVPIALAVLLVRLFIQLLGFLRLSADPDTEPVGIPLIETVDEQAQHEIETGLAGELDGDDPPGGHRADTTNAGP